MAMLLDVVLEYFGYPVPSTLRRVLRCGVAVSSSVIVV